MGEANRSVFSSSDFARSRKYSRPRDKVEEEEIKVETDEKEDCWKDAIVHDISSHRR